MSNTRFEILPSVRKFIYRPLFSLPADTAPSSNLEVRVPVEFFTSKNDGIEHRRLWGTDVYTEDSDLIAMLQHCGYVRPIEPVPLGLEELIVLLELLPNDSSNFRGTERNNLRSRSRESNYSGRRVSIVDAWTLSRDGNFSRQQLWPSFVRKVPKKPPGILEAGPVDPFSGRPFVFSLSGETVVPYSITHVADTSPDTSQWLFSRLFSHVIVVECGAERFELSRDLSEKQDLPNHDYLYKLKKVVDPTVQLIFESDVEFPLGLNDAIEVYGDLKWEELKWSTGGLVVRSLSLLLNNVCFVRRQDAQDTKGTAHVDNSNNAVKSEDADDEGADAEEDHSAVGDVDDNPDDVPDDSYPGVLGAKTNNSSRAKEDEGMEEDQANDEEDAEHELGKDGDAHGEADGDEEDEEEEEAENIGKEIEQKDAKTSDDEHEVGDADDDEAEDDVEDPVNNDDVDDMEIDKAGTTEGDTEMDTDGEEGDDRDVDEQKDVDSEDDQKGHSGSSGMSADGEDSNGDATSRDPGTQGDSLPNSESDEQDDDDRGASERDIRGDVNMESEDDASAEDDQERANP
ncbi:hypothetical protein NDN08_006262 [Rhodosorus marinus]|uniref:Histone chaperone RTT106/FACT complex subunit SPT16-like middle domain-containing protein n=1 Tax=Rhodosorus marinus TaxID=101924 RepID=A0AAV8UKA5_9RHOD|nr:hypothetical protein NDN08_006262 [Rhodosorus marinus]